MRAAEGAIVPVGKVRADAGYNFDPKASIPAVVGYYTAPNGQMLSFPLNSSTTVLNFNKDAFRKAGLDPNKPPQTWPELALAAAKLKASGHACPFTTSWQSWTQLESFSTWHNTLFATENNGFGGPKARLAITTPLHERHLNNLLNWSKNGLFVYPGRTTQGDAKFYSGECAMLFESSGGRAGVLQNATFSVGFGMQPYSDDVPGAPQNSIRSKH